MSNTQWTQEEAEQVQKEIKKRAMTDPQFRTLALKDPNAAIAKINSKPLPASYKVRCIEASGFSHTVVLPDPVSNAEELSDADLEQVAGGNRVNVNL